MSVKSQQSGVGSSKVRKGTSSNKISDDGLEVKMDERGVIKRKSRNLSEKKRRDQFNILINELCSMVCTGKRKMDKSTILKSAISFIRNHNQVTMQTHCQEAIQEDWKPSFLSNEEFTHLMLEALDEFIVVISSNGKILYVSENITSLLGHTPTDLIGTKIAELVWDNERIVVESFLESWGADHESNPNSSNKENHISLICHLRRGNISDTNNQHCNYELVFFSGYYRVQGNPDGLSSASRVSSSWGDDSKESTNFGDALSQYNGLVFVASARLQTPQLSVEMSIVDVSKSEFTSRHSLEWKFLFLDHRGPPIIGYLPFEVLGTSGYDYYHIDDLEKVSACHEALMQKGEVTSCCYRFLTKGQQWIWLQTKYYITYHQWYSKPEFIVCSHRVISYSEVSGHPAKLDSEECDHVSNSSNPSVPKPLKSEFKLVSSSGSKDVKFEEKVSLEDINLKNVKRGLTGNNMNRERNRHSKSASYNLRQYQLNMSDSQPPESPNGESVMLRPPQLPTTESVSSHHSRHPSGSSRVGTALSDTGSISSSGSFQSAASMQSDQSMHSIQSHNSMQSAHGQPTQQNSSFRSSNQPCTAHLSVNTNQNVNKQSPSQFPNQQSGTSSQQVIRNTNQIVYSQSRTVNEDSYFPPNSVASSVSSSGHRFLQPRTNASGTSLRRGFAPSSSPSLSSVSASNSVSSSGASFTYQSVLPISVDSSSVTLPVQRIIEGLPVVTLPGIVAHEPIVMTAAQREFHERLRLKHLEIQKSIMAQQEELRRVETELLLAQYGAWGPTVLKMTVPFTEAERNSTSEQPTLLSSGGLVTCLTADNSISLGQPSSAQGGNSNTSSVTFSPGTPILVQSPSELHARSPDRDFLSHEIQILLAQSLLQDNGTSVEFLP